MLFNTLIYGFFLIGFFVLYWFLIPTRYRPVSLLIASFMFFTYHFPIHTILIFLLTVMVFYIGLAIEKFRKWEKQFLVAGLILTLGVLCYYKYTKMVFESINELLLFMDKTAKLPIPEIIVPLGISFFTFQKVHYLIDVYRGTAPKVSFVDFTQYVMFFPTFISGPIERIQHFYPQTKTNTDRFRKIYLFEGVERILIGLFKKIVIADAITPLTDALQRTDLSSVEYWIAAYAYALKIYMDFSGYSDIAIGSARLFGYKIMENFNWPYLQRNLSLFWRNWHMSLTSWFRDYLFIPLGGSRVSEIKTIRNILIVWAATGIWHGAAWHFVFWGLFHAMGLIILKYYTRFLFPYVKRLIPNERIQIGMSGLLTFHYVVIGWVFFVCDFKQSFFVIGKMVGVH